MVQLFRSLASLYTLVCVLSVLQLALGLWTLISSGFGFWEAGVSQVALVVSAVYTLVLFFLLRKYQRRPGHKMSRVHDHMKFLAFMFFFWLFFEYIAAFCLFARGFETVLTPCSANWFLSTHCSPLALGMVLPLVNCAIALCARRRIFVRARAIHGEEMVVLPTPPQPVKRVPAWELGSLAELEAGYSQPASVTI
ncbi:hypothetical protein MVEN_02400300 [Mycena venus]|uniref:Uncharacterized protein n=1 Tax=Mycena venus TaxID=2733690 RepID=A0A8H6X2N5_9AGAR|nr:hypothetical protein MVEN_02400300 [Mycena venus]